MNKNIQQTTSIVKHLMMARMHSYLASDTGCWKLDVPAFRRVNRALSLVPIGLECSEEPQP